MSFSITYTAIVAGLGQSIHSQAVTRSGSGSIGYSESLPAGTAGVLTTRASGAAGTITLETGHGITTGDKIDVFSDGGVSYGATAGTIAAAPDDTSIPFTLAEGDDLPAEDADVVVSKQVTGATTLDGDSAKLIAMIVESTTKSRRDPVHVQLLDESGAEVAELDLLSNVPAVFDIEGGSVNPFSGDPIASVKIGNGGAESGQNYQFRIIGVQNATS